jgi:TnpA family transposase
MAYKQHFPYEERIRFDTPPVLSSSQKYIFCQLPSWAENYYRTIVLSTSKIGFLLQLGYFRTVCRFFEPAKFHEQDIAFVIQMFKNIDVNDIDLDVYLKGKMYYIHRQIILQNLGYHSFGDEQRTVLLKEAKRLAHLQVKPANIFDSCVFFLREKRIETPQYTTLHHLMHTALAQYENDLEKILENHLRVEDKNLLDELLQKGNNLFERYELTNYKKIPQSMKPSVIKYRVELFSWFKQIVEQLQPLIVRLNLSDATVRYYAQYVLDTRSANVVRRGSDKYLLLIAFVIHQYLCLGDALVLTLIHATTTSINSCEYHSKEMLFQHRHHNAALVNKVTDRNKIHMSVIGLIEKVAYEDGLEDDVKIRLIKNIIQDKKTTQANLVVDLQQVDSLQEAQLKLKGEQEFYAHLEKESIVLQKRLSPLLQHIVFDEHSSQQDIYKAVKYFQQKKGEVIQSNQLPTDFLSMDERMVLYTPVGKLKVSLYKALLFKEVVLQIKAGALNILSSYDYRSYEQYLIDKQKWQHSKDVLLHHANLEKHKLPTVSLTNLNNQLNQQFKLTNETILNNEAIYFDKNDRWHLHRYKAKEDPQDNSALFPQKKIISILEVLTQINKLTGFLNAFQYKAMDNYNPKRPIDNLFYAAVMGYGENIGIRKMGLISKNINADSLENVATQYFSPEMVLQANDLILAKSNLLPIIDLFRNQSSFIHTGSDGQKFDVSIASLRASASFKYFGNGKGITIYSHLDEAGQLIYSTVFSAGDREAPYILDALAHDEIISSDAHSTDTHGYSEAIAAITGLWGIESRPRLASIYKAQLYAIDTVAKFKALEYKIVPTQKVDYNLIIEHWDSILRLVTTIKLGHEKASTILRRLNSYSRQNPVYKALKELGRLYKTNYILRYISQEDLRQSVESMLSKVENANQFAKAVMLGNTAEFNWSTQYEQLIAEGCKRLIINAINYYNLLLLSQQLCDCKTPQQKEELVKIIAHSSTHTWRHINLHGEYDFSDQNSTPTFDMNAILNLDIG